MASCNMNDDQSVELSIVIVVDGEEKQCGSRPNSRPATPQSCCSNKSSQQQSCCCSRPTTPQHSQCCAKASHSAHSCCSGGGSGNSNKVIIPISVGKPVCQSAQSSCQQQQQTSCCQQQQQSSCCQQQQSPCQKRSPCQQQSTCPHSACQRQCQSQTSIKPPRIIPTGNCCCAALQCASLMSTCQQHVASAALPCRSKSQTTSCQTVGGVKCAPCASQTRTCTKSAASTMHVPGKKPCPKKKPCPLKSVESRTEAKSTICQTQPEIKPKPRRRDEEVSESSRTSRRKERPRERRARERSEEKRSRERSRKSDEVEMPREEKAERRERRRERRREERTGEEPPPSAPRSRQKKASLISPEQINFSQPPPVQMTFVDFFLQTTGGVTQVLNLAEAKHKYERKCKNVLSKLSEEDRSRAEKFFMKIVESIQVKFPDGNTTDVKTFQINKYTSPVMQDLGIDADRELRHIQKYHNYILGVVSVMEQRMRQREPMDPDAIIDVETALLAGIVARCYPLFMRMKDLLVSISKRGGSAEVPPQEFVKQLRKLILAIYVEILSIHVTFANVLDSLSTNMEVQDRYRKLATLRRGHARHSVTWAGRCIATVLLYDFLQTK